MGEREIERNSSGKQAKYDLQLLSLATNFSEWLYIVPGDINYRFHRVRDVF